MPSRFGIVIPAYNAARTIESTIMSVYLQTTDDFEIVVVDDGSTDGTVDRAVAVADERVSIVQRERGGPSAARNHAISRTQGHYVCPLDADDLLLPRFLETMGAALDADHEAGFAYTDAWTLDDATGRVRRASAKAYQRPPRRAPRDPNEFLQLLLDRNFVYGCTLIRRSVIETVGGYDEELRAAEDYELWLRIVAFGFGATHVEGRLAVYREGQSSSNSGDVARMARSQWMAYDRAAAYPVDEALRARAAELAEHWRLVESRASDRPRGSASGAADALRAARRRVLEPFRWHREAPPEVRSLLDATKG